MKHTHLVRQGIIVACALLFSAGLLGMSAAPALAQSAQASVKAPAGKTARPSLCIDNPKTHTYYCCNKGLDYRCCNLKNHSNSCCLSTGTSYGNSGCCAYQGNQCCPPSMQWSPNGTYTSKWKNDCGYGGGGCIYDGCGNGGGCGYGNVSSYNDWCCGYEYPNSGYQYPNGGYTGTGYAVASKSVSGKWSSNCGFGYGGGCYGTYGGYSYGYGNDCCYVGYAKPRTSATH